MSTGSMHRSALARRVTRRLALASAGRLLALTLGSFGLTSCDGLTLSGLTRGEGIRTRGTMVQNPESLTVGVAQLATEATLEANRDKIIGFVRAAKQQDCRVLVTPEGALHSPPDTPKAKIDDAIEMIRQQVAASGIYAILVALYRLDDRSPMHNRLLVINPEGTLIHTYDKIWCDQRFPNAPGTFLIDGIPCCAVICADRWHRSVEELPVFAGARIIFECSNNYANEWIPELQWYWYVPRALRNNVYVILCNASYERPGLAAEYGPGHGHSCVIAPDGTFLAAAQGEADRLLVATLDLTKATRQQAVQRHNHPLFRRFWDVGLVLLGGGRVETSAFTPLSSPEVSITMAAAQMACSRDIESNLASVERLMGLAKTRGADIVGFPELALTGTLDEDILAATPSMLEAAIDRVRAFARRLQLCVVLGAPHVADSGERHNSAYVIGADGALLTRYDQLVVDRPNLFVPGTSTKAMWYTVKGVPAVVTIGRDGLWTELAELAAVRGAQVHVHICYDTDVSQPGRLLRRQVWACLASYRTFTATVNAAEAIGAKRPSTPGSGYSMIWHDFFRGTSGAAGGYWPHCAEWLAQGAMNETVIHATQKVPRLNTQFERMAIRSNVQMRPWYVVGAQVVDDHT